MVIDSPVSLSVPEAPAALPVRPRTGRFMVLAVVFVCAACGLVYELELVALASYLIGDSVTQASVVLSVMVFAMGIGSLLAKRLRCRAAVGFGLLEAALALCGGSSALVLYATFAWLGGARYALVVFSLVIGVLIGAEIPLLMTLIQRLSRRGERRDTSGDVADLFAADYVGALVGGLAFPFLLLPLLGQLTGALLTGAVNTVAGGALVLWLFRHELTRRERWLLVVANTVVLTLLATATALVGDFERAARRAVYGERVRVAVHTDLQEIVVTGDAGRDAAGGRGRSLDLFLDGRLRVSGRDEHRYHEALVHPAMRGRRARVLILGGGDGLAAREVLRYPGVDSVTVVELDPAVVALARTDPALSALNGGALADPRLRVHTADAFTWLRDEGQRGRPYDVVISDLPDPGITRSTKLYSQEFYGLASRVLAPGGRVAVHAGPLATRPRVYWTVEATLRAAGLRTRPYRVTGRLSGFTAGPDRAAGAAVAPHDWGFVLAARATEPGLALAAEAPRLRSLSPAVLSRGERSAEGVRVRGVPPSTLVHPRYTQG
ncbi:spermidine synthase [Streptomyces agglomeratus]|uniref:Polyamine aminopropyltransferase n=1 Tax=Streptomyces agglomeratus TaxID=285458 RepID=A0A1E5P8J3_9ACTN|nr:polyamine aminopropyltransferase [Streptomyces agglomeratus]OEJ25862.1 spermidine synthase [Streptomyces agglomeratus]OEJ52642.1 spermidine synthase [Streptomyces agglomeratus]